MNFQNSLLVIFFFIKFFSSIMYAADIKLVVSDPQVLDQENKSALHSTFDPIQQLGLPVFKACKNMVIPLKIILLESTEIKIINGMEMQCTKAGFLPFYTNFWCTGIRLSIEILMEILYARRDYQKYHCSVERENHQARMRKFSANTHLFLKKAQECIEDELLLRQKSTFKWIEIALDGSILFLESLYENEPCSNSFNNVLSSKLE